MSRRVWLVVAIVVDDERLEALVGVVGRGLFEKAEGCERVAHKAVALESV